MTALLDSMRRALAADSPAVLVTVARAHGSTPREAGAAMLVTAISVEGTIGGGRLEFDAVARARAMLAEAECEAAMDVPLGPAIGQCCGGRVELVLRTLSPAVLAQAENEAAASEAARPAVLIFGAGHTGRALAAALSPLPLNVVLVDQRGDALASLPPGVTPLRSAVPEAAVDAAPQGTAFLVMTHDHGLDFLIAAAALRRPDAAYVGMIGSGTKREQFRRHLARDGREAEIDRLRLPIGGSALRDKRPEVIAAMTAAELLVCLSKGQVESLTDPLATGGGRCNSGADPEGDPAPRHAAAT
ncbi:xanthine dehydrogenase accessory protein XdhC [Mangrovibrevibacter kandeliae]|uniref:xanthine dehydrogenase accessory protein XdhC n=1 Tax=Mangrovibrevibacter kandeliae TaxID=2968473 RepID=UPI00211956CA|nr:xanthine dehydrogenase accessory protein XdhC [Aurantimonas sp. CSK15Z-1]MCQ8783206.1 xanthine dehydrogenase accessory protein XdhC [Aurantimonas sp. CSK15Z-1]